MSSPDLRNLANAFHAAAEQMRQPPKRHPMLANLSEPAGAEMSRKISADVLQYIGDVYLGQAVRAEETAP